MLKLLQNKIRSRVLSGILLVACGTFAAPARAERFSVVTFNTWGVPIASYDQWRYKEAMRRISEINPDFVLLQEVFSNIFSIFPSKGKRAFRNKDLYPYRADGPRALPRLVSSGLRILSKHPILRTARLVYRACKKDDCLSRKGALLAVVKLPSGQKLNIVTTHLNARGDDAIRQDQLDQLKAFMDRYLEPQAPLLLNGDLNFGPASPLYSKFIGDVGTIDTWAQTHDASDPGYTSDCENNAYARDYSIKHGFPLTRERIDYLLTRQLKPLWSDIIFDDGKPLSDHYGLNASYDLDVATSPPQSPSELPVALDLDLGVGHPVHDPEVAVVE